MAVFIQQQKKKKKKKKKKIDKICTAIFFRADFYTFSNSLHSVLLGLKSKRHTSANSKVGSLLYIQWNLSTKAKLGGGGGGGGGVFA